MRAKLVLLPLVALFVVCLSVGASCAQGVSGFFGDDAGVAFDASFGDAPSVVFPPDDPTSSVGDDAGTALEDASLVILPPLVDDDAGAAPTGPPFDAAPDGECTGPLSAGDLAIDELLISSVSGTGDHGEWLEVVSTRDCALDLLGLHGECPVGAKVITFDVTSDTWLAARGSFVVADSVEPAVNHALPGIVLGWAGSPGDVLRNEGTTVSLVVGNTLVDAVTYPAIKKLVVGTSMAFPGDCPPGYRSNWAFWQPSEASWFPGFHGTPNAPNDDVLCPDD